MLHYERLRDLYNPPNIFAAGTLAQLGLLGVGVYHLMPQKPSMVKAIWEEVISPKIFSPAKADATAPPDTIRQGSRLKKMFSGERVTLPTAEPPLADPLSAPVALSEMTSRGDIGWGPAWIPDPPLVGVEPNPGPRNGRKKNKNKQNKTNKNTNNTSRQQTQSNRLPASRPRVSVAPALETFVDMGTPQLAFSAGGMGRGIRVRGRQVIGSLQTQATASQNILCDRQGNFSSNWYIHPNALAMGPPLDTLALNFQRYRFHKFRLIYTPLCPTTTTTYFAMGISQDPGLGYALSYQQLLGMEGAVTNVAWRPTTVQAKPVADDWYDCYYASYSDRWTCQFVVHCQCNPATAGSVMLGNVYLEYDLEFMTLSNTTTNQLTDVLSRDPPPIGLSERNAQDGAGEKKETRSGMIRRESLLSDSSYIRATPEPISQMGLSDLESMKNEIAAREATLRSRLSSV